MRRPGARRGLIAIAGTALLAACGDGSTGPDLSESVAIEAPSSASVVVGDSLGLTATSSGTVNWSSSAPHVADVVAGRVAALRPGDTWIIAATGPARDSLEITVTARPGGYTAMAVDYFLEVALGYEFGGASEIVRRWASDVTYGVVGSPTGQDLAVLADVVSDINQLTVLHDLVEAPSPAVEIHFIPRDRFDDVLSGYVPGNVGYFQVWWNASQEIVRSVVLIATDLDQERRDHLIREEVTQMLGMGKDSNLFSESIFYGRFSLTDAYAPIDEAVIEMLYRPEVRIGMDAWAVAPVLRRLTRVGWTPAGSPGPTWPEASPPDPTGATVNGRPGRGSGGQGLPPPSQRLPEPGTPGG